MSGGDLAPRYVHDGAKDIFLGHWEEFDLYYCPGLGGGVVKARWSDRFWECLSERAHVHEAIGEARNRALDRRLILRYPGIGG